VHSLVSSPASCCLFNGAPVTGREDSTSLVGLGPLCVDRTRSAPSVTTYVILSSMIMTLSVWP